MHFISTLNKAQDPNRLYSTLVLAFPEREMALSISFSSLPCWLFVVNKINVML